VKISITLKDTAMRIESVKGLRNAHYNYDEIDVKGNTVSLVFDEPHTQQPYTRNKTNDSNAQKYNRYNCELYRDLTKDYKDTPSKLDALRRINPELFSLALNLGKSKDLFGEYEKIKGYLK